MIMADVLTWFLIIIGSWLVLNCYWLASVALFPGVVADCRDAYGRRPLAATVLGIALLAPAVIFGLTLAKNAPHPAISGLSVGAVLALGLFALLGSAGLALRVGTGLAAPVDATQPWRRVARGGAVLAFTFLLPFLGWFMVLPWALASGTGVAAMVLWRRAFPRIQAASPRQFDPPSVITTAVPK